MAEEISTTNDQLGEAEDANGIKIAVAQFGPGPNPAENVNMIEALAHAAAENGARLLVLPEYSSVLGGKLDSWVNEYAEPLDGPFVEAMTDLAEVCNMGIVVGMLEKSDTEDARPFNTAIAVLPGAGLVAKYRKVHLFDAYQEKESAWLQPGNPADAPETFEVDGMVVGLQTCFDLRFPESMRQLADAGVQLVALIAQWLAGPKKAHHWAALTSARAIENMLYIAAADQIPPIAVGMSRVISPIGETLVDMGQQMGVSIATVNPQAVLDAREMNPALDLRRYSIVPKD